MSTASFISISDTSSLWSPGRYLYASMTACFITPAIGEWTALDTPSSFKPHERETSNFELISLNSVSTSSEVCILSTFFLCSLLDHIRCLSELGSCRPWSCSQMRPSWEGCFLRRAATALPRVSLWWLPPRSPSCLLSNEYCVKKIPFKSYKKKWQMQ